MDGIGRRPQAEPRGPAMWVAMTVVRTSQMAAHRWLEDCAPHPWSQPPLWGYGQTKMTKAEGEASPVTGGGPDAAAATGPDIATVEADGDPACAPRGACPLELVATENNLEPDGQAHGNTGSMNGTDNSWRYGRHRNSLSRGQ
jgi:hypothetical protein